MEQKPVGTKANWRIWAAFLVLATMGGVLFIDTSRKIPLPLFLLTGITAISFVLGVREDFLGWGYTLATSLLISTSVTCAVQILFSQNVTQTVIYSLGGLASFFLAILLSHIFTTKLKKRGNIIPFRPRIQKQV